MREKPRPGQFENGSQRDDRWIERFLDELEETPEGKYMEGQPRPKYELNEPGLREKPERLPEGALTAEKEFEEALRDDPHFRSWKEKTFPAPKELKEPSGEELVPRHEPQDLIAKVEELLSGEENGTLLLDEDFARQRHLEREVRVRKQSWGWSVYTQSEIFRDPDAGAEDDEIIEATAYRLRSDRTELTFAVGEAKTQRQIDKVRVGDLDESMHIRIADLLRHLKPEFSA